LAQHNVSELQLIVTAREVASADVVALTLQSLSGAALPSWTPGAHIDLVLGNGLIRQYSLCSSPKDAASWRVAVLREAKGRGGSQFVHDELLVGTQVTVRGPRNHFEYLPAPRYLFIAGGIGITPLLPMVAAANQTGKPWQLTYGGRTRSSMAFLDELGEYGDRVHVVPQDEFGLLDLPALVRGEDVDEDTLIYCCGPEALLHAVEAVHHEHQLGSLRVERFSPREFAEPVSHDSFEVVLKRTGLSIEVGPDESILQAVEAAGLAVDFSCEEGTCGTCETAVCSGIPEHRDSVLSEKEQTANKTMMICVSRSRTPQLVLDL
jgi:ferredoxin-NADP reductase